MTNEDANELLETRRATYGNRITNMERLAALWSALLGVTIHDWQVPLLMSASKMLRTFETPDYSDSIDDQDGWNQIFREVMDANHGGIVQARTVEEYRSKKEATEAWKPKEYTNEELRTQLMDLRENLQILEDRKDSADIDAARYKAMYQRLKATYEPNGPRCGVKLVNGPCILPIGHLGKHESASEVRARTLGDSGVAGIQDEDE